MKNKKIKIYLLIIILIILIFSIGLIIIKNNKKENINEYIPLEEITEDQLRETNILLHFKNKEANDLITEIRKIDSKILLNEPEKVLIEMLIEGPQNNNCLRLIPENTKILDLKYNDKILNINFSDEFSSINNLEEKEKKLVINSIIKTLQQLIEINEIKILINGEKVNFNN